MSSAVSPSRRKQCDFTKLMCAGYEIELNDGNAQDFFVTFHGPKGTAYEGGEWKVHVTLPEDYPFASPSIGFVNKILHPNIDEASGSVCLDVINQTWTPIYSLVNVFDIFLPQLLTYPNATDPLNAEAGSLMLRDKGKYEEKIREYVRLHASHECNNSQQQQQQFNPRFNSNCSIKQQQQPLQQLPSQKSMSDLSEALAVDEDDDLSDF